MGNGQSRRTYEKRTKTMSERFKLCESKKDFLERSGGNSNDYKTRDAKERFRRPSGVELMSKRLKNTKGEENGRKTNTKN